MKKSFLYMGIILALTVLMTATQVLAAPADPLKPKKTPPGKKDPQAEVTREPRGQQNKENKEEKNGKKSNVNLRGVVLTSSATSLTIELKDGSTVVIAIDANTAIKYPAHFKPLVTETPVASETPTDTSTPEPSESPTVTETPVAGALDGLQVMVKAVKLEDGSYLALKIIVIPGKPVKLHHVGVVSAYTPGVSIEITSKDGVITTFLLTAETKYLPAGALDVLKVGDTVTIICSRTLGQVYTAAGVVLHGMPNTWTEEPTETIEPSETPEPSETAVPSETATP